MPWYKQKALLVFLVIFVHNTVLDLFFVSYNGPVFLWQENLHWLTIVVHLAIAATIAFAYHFLVTLRKDYQYGKFVLSERVLIGCSFCVLLSIGFLIS